MERPRIAVITRHGLNAQAWRARHARGDVADATPYGYHLAEPGFTLAWSHDHPESPLAHGWRMALRRVLGFDFVHVWRNRALVRDADAVWTHTEREHLAVALLKVLAPRTYRARSVAQSVWLWDLWPGLAAPRRWFFRRLLRRHDVEVVLSSVNLGISRAEVPGRRVVRVPFGTHLAQGGAAGEPLPAPPRILVIGNDRHRDWQLTAAVARLLPEARIDVLSLSETARSQAWPPNARVVSLSQSELLATAYRDATVVAIPLTPNAHASGCTVAIEAVSAGLPVVATDTGGIGEYLAGAEASLVPVGDVDAFARALRARFGDAHGDGRSILERGLTQHDYVARLVSLTTAVLEDAPVDPSVETFAPMDRTPDGMEVHG